MQETLQLRLSGGVDAPLRARAAVKAFNGMLAGMHDTVKLLISEIVTNSVRHAGAGRGSLIELEMAATPERVRVTVADPGPGFDPAAVESDPDESGGFGLLLVDRLADRWGVERSDGPARIWFELDRS
jgi:anti-sigma regulatory factor (Ser/Thr protein kinase)